MYVSVDVIIVLQVETTIAAEVMVRVTELFSVTPHAVACTLATKPRDMEQSMKLTHLFKKNKKKVLNILKKGLLQ